MGYGAQRSTSSWQCLFAGRGDLPQLRHPSQQPTKSCGKEGVAGFRGVARVSMHKRAPLPAEMGGMGGVVGLPPCPVSSGFRFLASDVE